MDPLSPSTAMPTGATTPRDAALRDAALRLEGAFLSEMLKAAGLGKVSDAFGGGPGEEQFRSFLVDRQAEAMARAGGLGLAESLYQALRERADG